MYKVVRKSEAVERKIAESKTVKNYITKDVTQDVSLAVTEMTDHSEKETTHYNRIYYVIKGSLILIIDGEEIILHEGDAGFIPAGTTYEMKGTSKIVTVNQPACGT